MTKRILVAGDVMLDSYWKGSSTRLSPEAPVPVVRVGSREDRLGGAANVALNLAKLGVQPVLCGAVGADANGATVRRIVTEAGIEESLVTGTVETIQKIRIISQNQQIVRADFESDMDETTLTRVTDRIAKVIPFVDCVIFSDYKKGALGRVDELIAVAKKHGIPVLIDPKGSDYTPYKGATVITPNKTELKAVAGSWKSETELRAKAEQLRIDLGLEKLLLTRSEEGMTLFGEEGAEHIPTVAKEVFDVSGAGDTAIAVLALMLVKGAGWKEAVETANRAAGIVVGRFGTSAVTAEDLGL